MRLDDLDSAILRALLADGRRSLRDVAQLVGSTPTTVGARLERLVEAGLVQGFAPRLAGHLLPGHTRLIEGQAAEVERRAVLAAAQDTPGVLHAAMTRDGRLVVIAQVVDLESEQTIVSALVEAGATDVRASPADRFEGPPPVGLFGGDAAVAEPCAECGKKVIDDGVIQTVDGRRVIFCCTSCQRLYGERYAAILAAADRSA